MCFHNYSHIVGILLLVQVRSSENTQLHSMPRIYSIAIATWKQALGSSVPLFRVLS